MVYCFFVWLVGWLFGRKSGAICFVNGGGGSRLSVVRIYMSSFFSSFGGILFVLLEEDLELVLLLPVFTDFFVGEAGRVSGAVYTESKEEEQYRPGLYLLCHPSHLVWW